MSDTSTELTPITFRVKNLDWRKLAVLNGCVNDAPFRGHDPGTVIAKPRAEEMFEGAIYYWDVNITLVYREDGYDTPALQSICPRTDFSKFTAEEFEAK